MSIERTVPVTQDELQFFRSIEAAPSYGWRHDGVTDPRYLPTEADPRYVPSDLIRYTAALIVAAETLLEYHHGQPSVGSSIPRRIWHALKPPETTPPRYTINDLLTDHTLNDPPLVLETDYGELPTFELTFTAKQHIQGFAEALREQPEVDETSLANQIIYTPRDTDATAETLLRTRSPSRDPLAVSIRALLRLQQQYNKVHQDQGFYNHEEFFSLPYKITTTNQDATTKIVTRNTCEILTPARYRLDMALHQAYQAKRPDKD